MDRNIQVIVLYWNYDTPVLQFQLCSNIIFPIDVKAMYSIVHIRMYVLFNEIIFAVLECSFSIFMTLSDCPYPEQYQTGLMKYRN